MRIAALASDWGEGIYRPPVHGWVAKGVMALVALHMVSAFYHQFVLKDGVVARMTFRK